MNKTIEIKVYGIVQGVGFRPTVKRHALFCGITGSVCNKGPYVQIIAQAEDKALELFLHKVENEPPKRAVILNVDTTELKEDIPLFETFEIIESEKEKGAIFIPPDIAVCEDCKREIYDPKDRRYLHPFINCTCCGPRLTILESLPYDRERTSMKAFPMCPSCEAEYYNPASRRYDAQPVCCNDCGPEVYLLDGNLRGRDAIKYARGVIKDGGIVAIKGIGGFHLCCDASNENAVARLRQKKRRPTKPFAVMMNDIETVRRECILTDEKEAILNGHQKPILLLERKESGTLCEAIAPGNPKIGVMLPYAPIQLLIFDNKDETRVSDMLVMTSANTSGAPICRTDDDARAELLTLADAVLSHNRDIRMRADDSVMDMYENKEYMIRRSRGYAPLPQFVHGVGVSNDGASQTEVLAMGGELKNAFCVGKGDLFYQSPYIGDMEDVRTIEAEKESVSRFIEMLEVAPQAVACDLHPKYNSVMLAEEYDLPIIRVQHHYAHILSCMAENDYMRDVIGVSFDGTGYGTDKTIWGGEILLAGPCDFERKGHIEPFMQVGGDASAKEGWRIALSLIYGETHDEKETVRLAKELYLCSETEAKVLLHMYDRGINAVTSTSVGRLFDAVSALLGICRSSTFEGEAATSLQFAAERYKKSCTERLNSDRKTAGIKAIKAISDAKSEKAGHDVILPTDRLFAWLLEERIKGTDTDELAYAFHEILSELTVSACIRVREMTEVNVAALSGGVFCNTLLLDLCKKKLEEKEFKVLIHHLIPPNDGGIALGQAVAARNILEEKDIRKDSSLCV